MNIRLANEEDAKQVSQILQSLKDDYYPYRFLSPAYILEKIKFKNDFFFLFEDGNNKSDSSDKITAVLRACIVDTDLAELRMMYVLPDHRRKGIGKNLIEYSLEFLKKKNMRKAIARVKSDNTAIIELLKKTGFGQEGYFREHYRKGVDIVQMARFL